MCLILLAWQAHPAFPLVVAANRDEFHERAASAAQFWQDHPQILAGRDLVAMGTWMGVTRDGRFAAVTNYRGATEASAAKSRGALPVEFLTRNISPAAYLQDVPASSFSGFNLLAADGEALWWMSNRDGAPRQLAPGFYALGNLLLDSAEVAPDKARLRQAMDPAPAIEPLFGALAPARVRDGRYGTRCSTVVLRTADGRTRFAERRFEPGGDTGETLHFEF